MPVFICLENKRNALNLLVQTQHKLSAKKYCGTIACKLGILTSFLFLGMKKGIKP